MAKEMAMTGMPERESVSGWENDWGLTEIDRKLMDNFAEWIEETYIANRLTMYPARLNGTKVVIVARADRPLDTVSPEDRDEVRLSPLAVLYTEAIDDMAEIPTADTMSDDADR